eukprot:UN26778
MLFIVKPLNTSEGLVFEMRKYSIAYFYCLVIAIIRYLPPIVQLFRCDRYLPQADLTYALAPPESEIYDVIDACNTGYIWLATDSFDLLFWIILLILGILQCIPGRKAFNNFVVYDIIFVFYVV